MAACSRLQPTQTGKVFVSLKKASARFLPAGP
jgi:hypothetical protein